jgi:cytidylate kinase
LVPAPDAVVVDSSIMDLQQVFELVMDHIQTVNDSKTEV